MVDIELYKTVITDDANKELKEIYYYIKVHLQEEVIARKLVNKIQKEIFDLEYMPRKYKILINSKRKKIYQKSIKNYNIIYEIHANKVYILHIFYSKRDYLKLI